MFAEDPLLYGTVTVENIMAPADGLITNKLSVPEEKRAEGLKFKPTNPHSRLLSGLSSRLKLTSMMYCKHLKTWYLQS